MRRHVVLAVLVSILSLASQGVASEIPPDLSGSAPFVGMNGVYIQRIADAGDTGELTPLQEAGILSYVRRKMLAKGIRILGDEDAPRAQTDPQLDVLVEVRALRECSSNGLVPVTVRVLLLLTDGVTLPRRPNAGAYPATTWLQGHSIATSLDLSDPSSLDTCVIKTIQAPLTEFIRLYLEANQADARKGAAREYPPPGGPTGK